MKKTKHIDGNKQYKFSQNIKIVEYQNNYIVVSVDTANWIVLMNEEQLDFFHLLCNHSLQESLDLFNGSIENAKYTVMQLEARNFETVNVKRGSNTGQMTQLHLTNGCNMKCPHCYMEAGRKKSKELSTEDIFRLLDNYHSFDGNNVTLTGGEVCTRTDLPEIVLYAHKLGMKVDILTNGTLWTQEMINSLAPYLNRVQISIDGYSEEENAKVRGRGNFKKALSAVDAFVSANVATDVAITPWFDEQMETKRESFVSFAKSLIEKYKGKQFNIKFTGDLLDGREIHFSEKEKQTYETFANSLYKGAMGDIFDLPFIEFHREMYLEDNCEFGNLTIDAEGNVFFCPSIPVAKSVVNILTDSFEHIMELANKAKAYSNVENLEPCRHCELKFICGGDCRIKHFSSFTQTLNFDTIDQPYRKCNDDVKNNVYDLMVRTNEALFQ